MGASRLAYAVGVDLLAVAVYVRTFLVQGNQLCPCCVTAGLVRL